MYINSIHLISACECSEKEACRHNGENRAGRVQQETSKLFRAPGKFYLIGEVGMGQ